MWTAILTFSCTVLPTASQAGDDASPAVRVVMFTPADIAPPAGVVKRLTRVADAAERFLVAGMERAGYAPAVRKLFRRQADGSLEVIFATGESPRASGRYDNPTFAAEAIARASKVGKVSDPNAVWWVFVYVGDPPTRFNNYRGSGDSAHGGWALVNYDSRPGTIRPEAELGEGFNATFTLKGCIHELGHAFGLPHVGPNPGKRLGVSLMGPNFDEYVARVTAARGETRVYLTDLSAAMLWKHPLFSGTGEAREVMPRVRMADYKPRFDRARRRVSLRGMLVADRPAHTVVVLDLADAPQGSYWSRGYAARLADDGSFRVDVTEPVATNGHYRIMFCFDNGVVTGDGKGHGDASALVKRYRLERGALRFEP
jgi:hypothetical protein